MLYIVKWKKRYHSQIVSLYLLYAQLIQILKCPNGHFIEYLIGEN